MAIIFDRAVRGLLAATALVPLVPAVAQTAPAAQAESAPSDIVVTATKRSERLIDVPLSVSVISSEAMAAQNVVRVQDYVARVPGLAVNTLDNGQVQIAIRGITTGGTLTNTTVGTTIDDVPVGGSTGYSYGSVLVPELDPSSVQEVNVLRGPQGTLYGASSLGGLLRYVTRSPDYSHAWGSAAIGGTGVAHGEMGFTTRGLVNLPLGDAIAVQANGFYRRDPGYVDDRAIGAKNVNRVDNWGGRVALGWKPVDALSIKLSALLKKSEGDGSSQIDADSSLRPTVAFDQNRQPDTGTFTSKLQLYSAAIDLDLDFATLTGVSGYNVSSFGQLRDGNPSFLGLVKGFTGTAPVGAVVDFSVKMRKFSQEVRLASPSNDRFEWLIGGFYTHERSKPMSNISAVGATSRAPVLLVESDRYPSTYEEVAGFATFTYHFTPRLDLQAGGRYGRNRQSFVEVIDGPAFVPPYSVPIARSKENVFTYSVSPRFRINRNMTLYARVASGYRPGGPNSGVGFGLPQTYKSDRTTNYEIGYKAQFLNGALYVDGSIYHIDWKDIQLQQTDPTTGFVYFGNATKARSQGFDLSVTAHPIRPLTIAATLGYTDAVLAADAPGIATSPRKGSRLPYTAPWSASLATDYDIPLTDTLTASVGGTVAYLDERKGDYIYFGQVTLPDYTTFDLRTSLTSGGWKLSAFASNIFDKTVPVSVAKRSRASTVYTLIVNRPRTIGVELSRKF